jgi:predicted DNA-binding protein (MmcQ/YjbR family)
MKELKTFLQTSLNLPGAVIINFNKAMPDIENDVDFYEIGVQQAVGKTPKRFANICSRDNEVVMIYFKHDPEIILDLYQQYSILPSEIASAHWSKIDFPNELSIESINAFIDKSYQLICVSLPKNVNPN